MSGSPLVFLDMRERPILRRETSREGLISQAMAHHSQLCDSLLEDPSRRCERMVVDAIAYFMEALNGQVDETKPDHTTVGVDVETGALEKTITKLYQAIESARNDDFEVSTSGLRKATKEQVSK